MGWAPMHCLCRDSRVDFTFGFKPGEISFFRVLLHLAKELHGFWFIARFGWIVDRDDHFHFNGYNVLLGLNVSRFFDTLARNSHFITCRKSER